MNIILISNPHINIIGAVISSIACQVIVFAICMHYLNKEIKLQLNLKQHLIKPTIASAVMGILVFLVYKLLINYVGNSISCIISIIVGVISYLIAVLAMKILTKEDIYMIPYGTRIYSILLKLKIYKE